MAHTYSPRGSPPVSNLRRGGTRSPSPVSHPQSKREKRRNMLSDKLAEMVASFSANHVEHFYAQLSALQCDINLVLRADPYRDGPLEDAKEDIDRLIAVARDEICRTRPIAPEAEGSFHALAGQFYAKFVNDVNAAMEERDKDLTEVHQRHKDAIEALHRENQYKRQLAHEEHALLSNTLRERLIQSVTAKRAKLLRDKEQLDIADSNALLLNPTQFSIGNPASPGGALSNRKTRNTRGRTGDAQGDDSAADGKRKRKAPFDEENAAAGGASPAARPETSSGPGHQPYRDAKARLMSSQFEAPLYSIERLFSEKELAMNMNRAYLQTNEYFEKLRAQGLENRLNQATASLSSHGKGGDADDGGEAGENGADGAQHEHDEEARDSPSPSKDKEQQPAHATRSQRTQTDGYSLGYPPPPYGMTISISTSASKTNATAPALPGLLEGDASADMEIMRQGTQYPGHERLIERGMEKGWNSSLGDVLSVGATTASQARGLHGLDALGEAAEREDKGKSKALESVAMGRTASGVGSESGRRGRRA